MRWENGGAVASIATSELQGPQFDPLVRPLYAWSFTNHPMRVQVSAGFFGLLKHASSWINYTKTPGHLNVYMECCNGLLSVSG